MPLKGLHRGNFFPGKWERPLKVAPFPVISVPVYLFLVAPVAVDISSSNPCLSNPSPQISLIPLLKTSVLLLKCKT